MRDPAFRFSIDCLHGDIHWGRRCRCFLSNHELVIEDTYALAILLGLPEEHHHRVPFMEIQARRDDGRNDPRGIQFSRKDAQLGMPSQYARRAEFLTMPVN